MDPQGVERKLAAILSADVVGYSRLMAEDEAATIRTLTAYREQVATLVREHRGRVVDSPGDNVLAEFPTALDAAQAAVEIQRVIGARNADLPSERRMEFRVGIHLGDISVEGERIYGEGVNIAARLEGLADPGGICISQEVHGQVESKLDLRIDDLGERQVKNIPKPVRVYGVRIDERGAARVRPPVKGSRVVRRALLATAAVLLLIGAGIWATWPRPLGLLLDFYGLSGPPVNPSLPDKPSIVVLPFTNMSADPEQEYFSDGISEDLTTDLSSIRGLFVIARNSAFTYKGKSVKAEDVGRELGVRYVLEGSVRKVGDRVRITAQLIDATTGFHLWSERYDRDLDDLFALQSEISEAILRALQVEIQEAEVQRIQQKPTRDLSAYDAVMQGWWHLRRMTRGDNATARKLFERAIKLDPDYAEAYALLGGAYDLEWLNLWNLDPSLEARPPDLEKRALELDPLLPLAHARIAGVRVRQGRLDEAVLAAERAIELAPSFDLAHFVLAGAYAGQGRHLAATQAMNRALRLNPRSQPLYRVGLGWVNYRAGRTREAVGIWEEVRAFNPDQILARIPLAIHYEREGRHAEARAVVEEILRVNPDVTAGVAATRPVGRADPDFVAEAERLLRSAGLPETALSAAAEFTVPGFGGRPAIAVLPFDNLSRDPEQEYFADGIAEDLITRLSSWGMFPVIARNSSFVYKGKAVDIKQVSRELGARYVVEGSVRRAQDRVRISAQLIDATTGHHIWAKNYDRELRDIFVVQDEITEAVVVSMYPTLQQFDWERAAHRQPENLDAWDAVSRGMWHLNRLTKGDNEEARRLLQHAIELDPQLAAAFSALAWTHYTDIIFLWTDSADRSLAEMLRAAERSVAFDDRDPYGYLALTAAHQLAGQHEKARVAVNRALELNPSLALAYYWSGVLREGGIEELRKAVRLSPQGPWTWVIQEGLAHKYFEIGQYEEAVNLGERVVQQRPDYLYVHLLLAASYAQLDRVEEAHASLEKARALQPDVTAAAVERFYSPWSPTGAAGYIDGLRKAGLKE